MAFVSKKHLKVLEEVQAELSSCASRLEELSDFYEEKYDNKSERWQESETGSNASNWNYLLTNEAFGGLDDVITAINSLMRDAEDIEVED